jgi:transposase
VSESQCTDWLGGWEGYQVEGIERREASGESSSPQLWIRLAPQLGRRMECEGCGEAVDTVHDVTERWIRDLPVLDAETYLLVARRRLDCPRCGPRLERLSWLERYARVTRRLADSVARLCTVLPIKHVAEFFHLGWDTVKHIDHVALERRIGPPSFEDVEVIAMDEFAIQKGHRYATVVVDARTKRVLWVGRGRDRDSVRVFFQLLGKDGCARLRAVVMDMSATYELEVREHCPYAEVVFDLFHVVAKYGREVVDRVRVDQANKLRGDKPARKIIKGARWMLLRNRENVRREDQVRLDELLRANRSLLTVYVLKDDLKHLWDFRSRGHALRFWKGWYSRAIRSRLEPLKRFARNLVAYLPGILAHCQWPLHTSFLEGINNKIKVIKRMAYGFRDDAYFFLKIRAAFPGKTG